MGTNFYMLRDSFVGQHIGKRSVIGPFCWDCEQAVHDENDSLVSAALFDPHFVIGEPADTRTALAELGFAEPRKYAERPRGIASASSFTWAIDPKEVTDYCQSFQDVPAVRDEYGREYTGKEFLEMLKANCPVEDTQYIGKKFT